MLLNTLRELIQEDPLREEVNLENKGITFLDTNSVELLSRLKNLRVLNLAENYLQRLPCNLQMLANLSELNLNGNPLEEIQQVVDALKTIGPNLASLHINLFEEDQVDYLLRHLEQLEVLNGLKVERDALFNEEESSDQEQQLNSSDRGAPHGGGQEPVRRELPFDDQKNESQGNFVALVPTRNHGVSLSGADQGIRNTAYMNEGLIDGQRPEIERKRSAHFGKDDSRSMSRATSLQNQMKESHELDQINMHLLQEQISQNSKEINGSEGLHLISNSINEGFGSPGQSDRQFEETDDLDEQNMLPEALTVNRQPHPRANDRQENANIAQTADLEPSQTSSPSEFPPGASNHARDLKGDHQVRPHENQSITMMLPSEADGVILSQDDIRERLQQTDGTLAQILNQGKIGRSSQEWAKDMQKERTGLSSNDGTAHALQLVNNFDHQGSLQAHSSVTNTLDQRYLSVIQESSSKQLGAGDEYGKAGTKQSEPEHLRGHAEKKQQSAVLEDARTNLRRSTLEQKYSPVLQNRRRSQSNNHKPNAVYGARPQSPPGRNDSVQKRSASGRSRGSSAANRRERKAAVDGGHHLRGSPGSEERPSARRRSVEDSSRNRVAQLNAVNDRAQSKECSDPQQRSKSAQSRESQSAAGRRDSSRKRAARNSTRMQSQHSRGMNIQTDKNENIGNGSSLIQQSLVEDLTTPVYDNIGKNINNELQREVLQEQNQKAMIMCEAEALDVLKPIDVQEVELSSTDLESIAIIYDKIRQIHKQFMIQNYLKEFKQEESKANPYQQAANIAQAEDQRLAQDFDSHLTDIMTGLNERLKDLQEQKQFLEQSAVSLTNGTQLQSLNFMRQSLIMQTKHSLIRLCYTKTRELITQSLRDEGTNYQKFVVDLESIMQNLMNYSLQIQERHFQITQTQADQIMRTAGLHSKQSSVMQNDNSELQANYELQELKIRELTVKLQTSESQNHKLSTEIDNLKVRGNNKSAGSDTENINLQNQGAVTTNLNSVSSSKKRSARQQPNKTSRASAAKMQYLTGAHDSTSKQQVQSNQPPNSNDVANRTGKFKLEASKNQNQKAGINNSHHNKVLPLKQLKDVINDIYSQKIKFDRKCRESQLPVETMEQFMYTYLNQKYGLKTLIIEWASTIINGVRTYLRDDHEVTLFAKILKNECDEEFRFIQMHVRDSLAQMLRQVLREKYPLKSEADIAKECEQIQNSTIDDWQWKKILNKMYEREDANLLNQKFQEIVKARNAAAKNQNDGYAEEANTAEGDMNYFQFKKQLTQKQLLNEKDLAVQTQVKKSKSRSRLSREEEQSLRKSQKQKSKLLFQSEFQKGILDFQLQEHERFLYQFNQLFKQVDSDNNGIINEREFRNLILSMNVVVQNANDASSDIDSLLRVLDPHNNQHMTYSEVVQLLSNQLVPQQITHFPQLQNQENIQSENPIFSESEFMQQNHNEHRNPMSSHNSLLQTPKNELGENEQARPNQMANGGNLGNDYRSLDLINTNNVKLVPILEKFFNYQSSQNLISEESQGVAFTNKNQHQLQQQPQPQFEFMMEGPYNQALLARFENQFNNEKENNGNDIHQQAMISEGDQNLNQMININDDKEMNANMERSHNPLEYSEADGAASSSKFSNRQLISNMNIGNVYQQKLQTENTQQQRRSKQQTHSQHSQGRGSSQGQRGSSGKGRRFK